MIMSGMTRTPSSRRSPHGERGLKCEEMRMASKGMPVALLMESVD